MLIIFLEPFVFILFCRIVTESIFIRAIELFLLNIFIEYSDAVINLASAIR